MDYNIRQAALLRNTQKHNLPHFRSPYNAEPVEGQDRCARFNSYSGFICYVPDADRKSQIADSVADSACQNVPNFLKLLKESCNNQHSHEKLGTDTVSGPSMPVVDLFFDIDAFSPWKAEHLNEHDNKQHLDKATTSLCGVFINHLFKRMQGLDVREDYLRSRRIMISRSGGRAKGDKSKIGIHVIVKGFPICSTFGKMMFRFLKGDREFNQDFTSFIRNSNGFTGNRFFTDNDVDCYLDEAPYSKKCMSLRLMMGRKLVICSSCKKKNWRNCENDNCSGGVELDDVYSEYKTVGVNFFQWNGTNVLTEQQSPYDHQLEILEHCIWHNPDDIEVSQKEWLDSAQKRFCNSMLTLKERTPGNTVDLSMDQIWSVITQTNGWREFNHKEGMSDLFNNASKLVSLLYGEMVKPIDFDGIRDTGRNLCKAHTLCDQFSSEVCVPVDGEGAVTPTGVFWYMSDNGRSGVYEMVENIAGDPKLVVNGTLVRSLAKRPLKVLPKLFIQNTNDLKVSDIEIPENDHCQKRGIEPYKGLFKLIMWQQGQVMEIFHIDRSKVCANIVVTDLVFRDKVCETQGQKSVFLYMKIGNRCLNLQKDKGFHNFHKGGIAVGTWKGQLGVVPICYCCCKGKEGGRLKDSLNQVVLCPNFNRQFSSTSRKNFIMSPLNAKLAYWMHTPTAGTPVVPARAKQFLELLSTHFNKTTAQSEKNSVLDPLSMCSADCYGYGFIHQKRVGYDPRMYTEKRFKNKTQPLKDHFYAHVYNSQENEVLNCSFKIHSWNPQTFNVKSKIQWYEECYKLRRNIINNVCARMSDTPFLLQNENVNVVKYYENISRQTQNENSL